MTKPVSLAQLGAALARRVEGAPRPAAAAAEPAIEPPPLLDADITAAIFGEDGAGRAEMAALFADTADGLRQAIDAHLAEGDAGLLSEAAHSLASAALSLGATRLGLAARALEHAADAERWPTIPELAERVRQLDEETRAALAE